MARAQIITSEKIKKVACAIWHGAAKLWQKQGTLGRTILVGILTFLFLCPCCTVTFLLSGRPGATPTALAMSQVQTETVTHIVRPTRTSRLTQMPRPTRGPAGTLVPPYTLRPTYTLAPTYTPRSTYTLAPTATARPRTPCPTKTPRPSCSLTCTPTSTRTLGLISTATPILTSTFELPKEIAQVVRVIDGDTIEVMLDGRAYKVRYIGIDCPETTHSQKGSAWLGSEAREANRKLVEGKMVTLEKDISETDKYGRLLRYIWVGDTLVNAAMVRLGYAQSLTYPPDVKYQDLFAKLEGAARVAKRGLWGKTSTLQAASAAQSIMSPAPIGQPTALTTVGSVQIKYIFYDGGVPRVESDEYCEIINQGSVPMNLKGWRLNADDPGQDFWFPDFVLQPGQTCRIYTNERHPEWGGLSFGSGRALWNNSDKECGHLFDATGKEVSTYCY